MATRAATTPEGRATGKPCPWCGAPSGYESITTRQWLRIAWRGPVSMVVSPVKSAQAMIGPQGIAQRCVNCGEAVGLCPNCDTPNRELGTMPMTCKTCGTSFAT